MDNFDGSPPGVLLYFSFRNKRFRNVLRAKLGAQIRQHKVTRNLLSYTIGLLDRYSDMCSYNIVFCHYPKSQEEQNCKQGSFESSHITKVKRRHQSCQNYYGNTYCSRCVCNPCQCLRYFVLLRLGLENALWHRKRCFRGPLYSVFKRVSEPMHLFHSTWQISSKSNGYFEGLACRQNQGDNGGKQDQTWNNEAKRFSSLKQLVFLSSYELAVSQSYQKDRKKRTKQKEKTSALMNWGS